MNIRKKKDFRLSAMLLAFIMVFSMAYSGKVYAGEGLDPCGDNLETGYNDAKEGTYNLYIGLKDNTKDVSMNKMDSYEDKSQPWESIKDNISNVFIDYGVADISDYAFYDVKNLQSIYIPVTVEQIGLDAFYKINKIQKVYYGGTEADWNSLAENIAEGNDTLLNADIIFMDMGSLELNLYSAPQNLKNDELKSLYNTLDYFVMAGRMKRQDEPITLYDIDNDGTWDLKFYTNSIGDADVSMYETESISAEAGQITFRDYSGIRINGNDCIYDHLEIIGQQTDGNCRYYSSMRFSFADQNCGSYVIDLREGDKEITKEEYDRVIGTLSNRMFGDMSYPFSEGFKINLQGPNDDLYVDVENDGNNDVHIIEDGGKYIVKKLDDLKKNSTVSLDDDEAFLNYVDNKYDQYYYSSVMFKVKDEVAKVDEIPATCTGKGSEAFWQSTDNANIYSDADAENKIESPVIIPALGHDWGEWTVIKKPTLTEEGIEERVCKRDASHKEQKPIKKLTPTPSPKPSESP